MRGLCLGLKEPVEKRPPILLVDGDVAGELREPRGPWLAGEECHPISFLLTVTSRAAVQTLGGEEEEESKNDLLLLLLHVWGLWKKPSRCCRHVNVQRKQRKGLISSM